MSRPAKKTVTTLTTKPATKTSAALCATPAPVAGAPMTKPVLDDALVRTFQPIIRRIAYRLASRLPPNVLVEDLVAAGSLGLVQAAGKFDPSRGVPFQGYAEFRIRGAMLDELRSMDWIPRAHRDRVEKLERAEVEVQRRTGRDGEVEEVAAELGVSVDEYVESRERNVHLTVVSLDELTAASNGDVGSRWNEPAAGAADEVTEASSLRELLAEAMEELPPRLRQVASLYYFDERSLKDIGASEKVTESRACQLRGEAVKRLRASMARTMEAGEMAAAA